MIEYVSQCKAALSYPLGSYDQIPRINDARARISDRAEANLISLVHIRTYYTSMRQHTSTWKLGKMLTAHDWPA